ncbi:MAG: DUF2277 domain-containing protein [Candidatus Nanopelagicales bacterium]
MCRNITTLRGLEPSASPAEVHAAALQYVRKVTGVTTASAMARPEFQRAVEAVATATADVIASLPPRRTPPKTEPPLRRLSAATSPGRV